MADRAVVLLGGFSLLLVVGGSAAWFFGLHLPAALLAYAAAGVPMVIAVRTGFADPAGPRRTALGAMIGAWLGPVAAYWIAGLAARFGSAGWWYAAFWSTCLLGLLLGAAIGSGPRPIRSLAWAELTGLFCGMAGLYWKARPEDLARRATDSSFLARTFWWLYSWGTLGIWCLTVLLLAVYLWRTRNDPE